MVLKGARVGGGRRYLVSSRDYLYVGGIAVSPMYYNIGKSKREEKENKNNDIYTLPQRWLGLVWVGLGWIGSVRGKVPSSTNYSIPWETKKVEVTIRTHFVVVD